MNTILNFGKHKNKSFTDVLNEDKKYCLYVLQIKEPHSIAIPFIQYLLSQEENVLKEIEQSKFTKNNKSNYKNIELSPEELIKKARFHQ